eukprot:CAMPEP_0168772396 /NCGR_PEP_ID=MMETSP0725-20121227/3936_1 /TAXON_ID=265536 /ORGANISM="Amphiprora sp., Strain CCMP467" /LENGTH=61 /DNA_ID=CAMNT_0008821915 /DNA_START=37 /DNA_END=222 /DNA_ORIENTATION=+
MTKSQGARGESELTPPSGNNGPKSEDGGTSFRQACATFPFRLDMSLEHAAVQKGSQVRSAK